MYLIIINLHYEYFSLYLTFSYVLNLRSDFFFKPVTDFKGILSNEYITFLVVNDLLGKGFIV